MQYLTFPNVTVDIEFTVEPSEDNSTGHPDIQLPSNQALIETHKILINGLSIEDFIKKYYEED